MKDKAKAREYIYVVRHGIAEDDHPLGDEGRALTSEGRTEFRAHAATLAPELSLVGIATSPLVRAVQTAEILAHACAVEDVRSEAVLTPERATPPRMIALFQQMGPGWAIVGHNPSFGALVGILAGVDPDGVSFRKGAIAVFRPNAAWKPPFDLVYIAAPGRKRQFEL